MWNWLLDTLHSYPELSIFLALAFGFWLGPKKIAGFGLGSVTATLLFAVIIGQFGITITGPIKSTFFLMFLFAVGYGVGPQFFAGLSKDGPRQIAFSVLVLALCLLVPFACAKFANLDLGYAVGLYAGSQTISSAIGVATDQINHMGLTPEQAKSYADSIPIGYAVTYIFGTIGSAIILAQLGPKLLGIDLVKVCADYEKEIGGDLGQDAGQLAAYRQIEVRTFKVSSNSRVVGKKARDIAPNLRVFIERVRRGDTIIEADGDTVILGGDVLAISGHRSVLVEQIEPHTTEVDDKELLNAPVNKVDVYITNKAFNNKTIKELADSPQARGIYLSKITRHMVEIPILPNTEILRGDILTLIGSERHIAVAAKALGYADRPVQDTDLVTVAGGIFIGGLIGALSIKLGSIPLSLSTSGGALLAGLLLSYGRTVHPTFGRIPAPALALMNTLGLNVFIAIVGINAGPGFVAGLQHVGISLFVWGIISTSVPMLVAIYLGHYVFKFHPAILFGVCAGVRTTTAALGMIQETAKSKVPALGYGMPYAIGNTLLTIFGLLIVLLMSHS
ncbi:aspartate-alanine antiporter [Deefgea salmonis]|uniref:Aspartate-alanine antiporter n=1 Tax=Deefgea salmonis TaxID=2875502 RepID=A0ABS8BG59_9NEIS|nr:aspartate-alanine antiporter [Deefgea salmonis]MCB5194697.1 aspartate-alanine antiporter [Deefgea salmonis]